MLLPAAQGNSLRAVLRADWLWCLVGAIACFLLASVLKSGFPNGLIPNLSYPFSYQGDGLGHAWMTQRAIEGWLFENPRSGYPFGSNFLDYPGSDGSNLLILKIFGQFTSNTFAAINLYFLTGFAVTFVSAFAVMRALGINRPLALVGAVAFDFVPFHFQRIDHLFYTWYFMAPLMFYLALRIAPASGEASVRIDARPVSRWLLALSIMAVGGFGVYYALFSVIILAVVALVALVGQTDFKAVRLAVLAIVLLVAGVLINLGPSIIHKYQNGPNLEVAQRPAADSENYAFKLVQLIMPRPDHRSETARKIATDYASNFPLINENITSSLGLLGSVGFIGMLLVVCAALGGRKLDRRLQLVALITLVLFMFGTLGGFGSLFSQYISTSIRSWNRISIFVAFGSLLGLMFMLQASCSRYLANNRAVIAVLSCAMLVGVWYDQTVPACLDCGVQAKQRYELDQRFVSAIEKSLPAGSAVYQLPYMVFPETAPLFGIDIYDKAAGFLHSRTLKWNYGGMKGRPGDLFYRALATAPVEKQIEELRRLGFAGVYIDRRGYEDKGQAVVERFSQLLGYPPTLQRDDGGIVFFPLSARAGSNAAVPGN